MQQLQYSHKGSWKQQEVQLSDREMIVLRGIVHNYILEARPIGSRFLAKHLAQELGVSPATIRNIMADLEEMGLITHPHTSAGRVPTDQGYRIYVDSLMAVEELSEQEAEQLRQRLESTSEEELLRSTTKILGTLSHYLSIIKLPELADIEIERIRIVQLSSERILIVVALASDVVRTLTVEAHSEITPEEIQVVEAQLNERLAGKSLRIVQKHLRELLEPHSYDSAVVRLFVESAERLLSPALYSEQKVHIAGIPHLLEHPEFERVERLKGIIELIEEEEIVVHLLEECAEPNATGTVRAYIGKEFQEQLPEVSNEILKEYSLLTAQYRFDQATGTIGLIGPKRMYYPRMFALLQFVAEFLSNYGTSDKRTEVS